MEGNDLHYLGLIEVGQRIQAGAMSSVAVTHHLIGRIESLDGELRSYAIVMADQALNDARRADAEIAVGMVRGPLHGVPMAVKDLCWTRGTVTAAGMPLYAGFKPAEDATVVRKLREAGAVILGKLQMTESAFAEHHPSIRAPVNPWHPKYWTGVSSSGSGVATASGLCYGSLGTDTGGSIRFPSAANGLTGIKPTWGRVSRHGVFELAASLDHVGPMARSAADAAAILGAIAGADPKDPTASTAAVPDYLKAIGQGVAGLRVGIDADWIERDLDAPTHLALADAIETLRALGATLIPVRFPDPSQVVADWVPLCAIEAAVAHEATYPVHQDAYGPALAGVLELGRKLSAMDYQKIALRRMDFTGRMQALFHKVDLLVTPVTVLASPTVDDVARMTGDPALMASMIRHTSPFDASGNPTITLPGGFTPGGMPVGVQFVAGLFEEAVLVRAGVAFQQATDWHRRHPAV